MSDSENKARQSSIDGFAHEHLVVGVLMKKYQNVSLVDLPLSSYDIIVSLRHENLNKEEIIRAQVKTARTNVVFTGGTRGGVDRTYRSDVKTYIQSTETSDVIVAFQPLHGQDFSLYFIPTILVEEWGAKSKSLNKLQALKENYEMLEKSKDSAFVTEKSKDLGLL